LSTMKTVIYLSLNDSGFLLFYLFGFYTINLNLIKCK